MKYSVDEALLQVQKRSSHIRDTQNRKKIAALSGISLAEGLLLMLTARVLTLQSAKAQAQGVYGSFLLQGKAGGYVLVAVIAFCAASILTFLLMRYAQKKKHSRH